MGRGTKATRAMYKHMPARMRTRKKNAEIADLNKYIKMLKSRDKETHLVQAKVKKYDYLWYSTALTVHNFCFMSNTLSDCGGATLGGENIYLENIIGTVVVSHKSKMKHWSEKTVCSTCDGINAPITEWTEPHHSTRVDFRLNKCFRDHFFNMRITICMSATTDRNVKKFLRMLVYIDEDSHDPMNDGGGRTYVTYFTPTDEELRVNKYYDDRFEFEVESSMVAKR